MLIFLQNNQMVATERKFKEFLMFLLVLPT